MKTLPLRGTYTSSGGIRRHLPLKGKANITFPKG